LAQPLTMDPKRPLLDPGLNRLPGKPERIHLMGICGTGMASLAGMLKERGLTVTGSDQNTYPPMSDFLERLGIEVRQGYAAANLMPRPDLVIVGNVITRENPEAAALAAAAIPYLSFPQALQAFAFEDKRCIVVAGTHGKTTTASLAAWVLTCAGLAPGFMIGGIPGNFERNFNAGDGPYFVIEGDEYDTAFFDKGPKFLHYRPWMTLLTSIEFDHADIYRDLAHVRESFAQLIQLIPPDGRLIVNGEDLVVMEEVRRSRAPVVRYGFTAGMDWRAEGVETIGAVTHFDVLKGEEGIMRCGTPLYGRHNIANALSVIALADALGIEASKTVAALQAFKGVKRRQEVVGEASGVLVIDDFAHHPTAVRETIAAVKSRYPDRRLLALFEPRSNSSRRSVFQDRYALAFDAADGVFIPEPVLMQKIRPEERFSSARLVEDLRARGLEAFHAPHAEGLMEILQGEVREGDVLLFMSNGGFDNLPGRIFERLTRKG